ncbi:DUF6886 family protein [Fictibacillus barbaricus]|uniref:Uncharacterized protein n=1 Tax=Fictibacillus barbaricus TaxID=182136 RepID=A0ABS2Z7I6_9BACL|nr:DUF6886 family protein [Fictibacillus barbaricus]MBN3543985.1 hypothetical protein [Fictibacillus barbaricus]
MITTVAIDKEVLYLLYHFSEEENIKIFHPRKHPGFPDRPPMVWAIDQDRSPLYYFPRDCPRIAFWAVPGTTERDRDRFFRTTTANKIVAIEGDWLHRLQTTDLHRYTFQPDHFKMLDEGAGYFVSYEIETPVSVEAVGNLLDALINDEVEIRIVPSLQPLSQELLKTTLHFSMIRMRNAKK